MQVRKSLVDVRDGQPDALGYLDGVRSCLAHDTDADYPLAVEAHDAGGICGGEGDRGHITYPDAVPYHQRFDVPLPGDGGVGPHQQLLLSCAETAGRHIQGRPTQHISDVSHRQAVAGQAQWVEDDPQHPLPGAEQGHVRHAGEGYEPRHDILLNPACQGILVQGVALDSNAQDFLTLLVGLEHRQGFQGIG